MEPLYNIIVIADTLGTTLSVLIRGVLSLGQAYILLFRGSFVQFFIIKLVQLCPNWRGFLISGFTLIFLQLINLVPYFNLPLLHSNG